MKTQAKCFLCFGKISTKLLFCSYNAIIKTKCWSFTNTKNLILKLLLCGDELLSTPKIITFLEKPLPKLHKHSPFNGIS